MSPEDQLKHEKETILGKLKSVLKTDKFSQQRRKSAAAAQPNHIRRRSEVLFDDSCSICMDNFSANQEIYLTPCNHCFHEACLMNWINTSLDKILKQKSKAQNEADR